MPNPNTCEKGIRSCSCKWSEECLEMHKLFAATDDARGKDPVRLDLSGTSVSNSMWRKAVSHNLQINEKNVKSWQQITVMRHHWSVDQLKYFYCGPAKLFPSEPIACSDIK